MLRLAVAFSRLLQDLIQTAVEGSDAGSTPILLLDVLASPLLWVKPALELYVVPARVVLRDRRVGARLFVILAVVPESEVDPAGYKRGVRNAQRRLQREQSI